jgi:hypothetical protein
MRFLRVHALNAPQKLAPRERFPRAVSLEQLAKDLREITLRNSMLGDTDHRIVKAVRVWLAANSIACEKEKRDCHRDTLIAIKERLRLREMISVRCRDFKDVASTVEVRVLSSAECRFHRAEVTDSRRAAKPH